MRASVSKVSAQTNAARSRHYRPHVLGQRLMHPGEPDFDLIVVGAGINGAAIAREAALAGMRVLIVERGDIGGGTSAASTRLIHGGLRYLEYAEIGLVYESLRERERLLKLARHLVEPIELVIPVYRGARRPKWQIGMGLALYDLLSMGKSVPSRTMLGAAELREKLPGLRAEALVGGASYYDAQVRFPERLVLENVIDAVRHGATLKTYTRVTHIRITSGRVAGVDWQDGSGAGGASSSIVVNAAGPWVDEVVHEIAHTRLIGGTKGSHLVVPPFPGAPQVGVYLEAGSDGRPFFVLPWNDLLLVGTTDERFEGDPGAARIDAGELRYLVAETERAFPSAVGLAGKVLYTQTGVRPLPHQPRGKTGAITRRHIVRRHRAARGLYSIVGGKLTTHRALAEDVMRKLRRDLPRVLANAAVASLTRERPLPGMLGPLDRDALLADLGARFGASEAQRLWRVYGGMAKRIGDRARLGELGEHVAGPGTPLAAEIIEAVESDWAVTLEDILSRRCMAGLDADFGRRSAAGVAAALERLGVWDRARAQHELAQYEAVAARYCTLPPD
jgi:glycerol-3-phosphate dehydrogenase